MMDLENNFMAGSRPSTFPKFCELAPELRLKIFSYIMPRPHVVPLDIMYMGDLNFSVSFDDNSSIEDGGRKKEEKIDSNNSTSFPLISKACVRSLSHTCNELRYFYHKTFPDQLELNGTKGNRGLVHLHYPTSIIYLRQLDRFISQPAISHFLFDRTNVSNSSSDSTSNYNDNNNFKLWHHSYFLPFPPWFDHITQLALPIDFIVGYPELSPHPFTLRSQVTESALFAKMLNPFSSLRYLWAVADDIYWELDIRLILMGYPQAYPGYKNVSVLGFLAERKEQLALWAEYRNTMRHRRFMNTSLAHVIKSTEPSAILLPDDMLYKPPVLAIWGMEHVDLWDFLVEFELEMENE